MYNTLLLVDAILFVTDRPQQPTHMTAATVCSQPLFRALPVALTARTSENDTVLDETAFALFARSPTLKFSRSVSLYVRSADVLELLPKLFSSSSSSSSSSSAVVASRRAGGGLQSLSVTTGFGCSDEDGFCFSLNATFRKVLSHLTALKRLSLVRSPVRDQALLNIIDCHRLEELDVSYCPSISDAAMERISQLRFLKVLDLRGDRRITSVGISHLVRQSTVQDLTLGSTDYWNDDFSSLVSSSSIGGKQAASPSPERHAAAVSSSSFSGLVSKLCELKSLRRLRIVFARLSSQDVSSLANCRQITTLVLDDCIGVTCNELAMLARQGLKNTLTHLELCRRMISGGDSVCGALPLFEKVDHLKLVQRSRFSKAEVEKVCEMPQLEYVELESLFCQRHDDDAGDDEDEDQSQQQAKMLLPPSSSKVAAVASVDSLAELDDRHAFWKQVLKKSESLLFASIRDGRRRRRSGGKQKQEMGRHHHQEGSSSSQQQQHDDDDDDEKFEFSAADLHSNLPPAGALELSSDDSSDVDSIDELVDDFKKNRDATATTTTSLDQQRHDGDGDSDDDLGI